MAIQKFPEFYRANGILRVSDLPDPEPALIKKLPIGSVIHYLGDEENPQLDISDTLILGYTDKVRYNTLVNYSGPFIQGGVRKEYNIKSINSDFDRRNRAFKHLTRLEEVKTLPVKQLCVINYAYLDKSHRYPSSRLALFQKFENKLYTLVDTIQKLDALTKRQHFIPLNVPQELIPVSVLNNRSDGTEQQLVKTFRGEDEQLLRHLWLYIDPAKTKMSAWGGLSDEQKKSVNFLFRSYDGKFTVVNLGYLYSWVNGNPNLTLLSNVVTKKFKDVQKYTLRSLIVMQSINANGASALAQEKAQEEQLRKLENRDKEDEQRLLSDQDVNESALQDQELEKSNKDIENSLRQEVSTKPVAVIGTEPKSSDVSQDEIDSLAIENDLAALEKIYERRMSALSSNMGDFDAITPEEEYSSEISETEQEIKDQFFKTQSPEQALISKLNTLADSGRINASEFRKKDALIKAAVSAPDPYGSNATVTQAAVITQEELKVTEEDTRLNVPQVVLDKSMAHSPLSVINERYNTKLIYKDMLACVQAVQKAGVVVKGHQVDTHHTALGSYDVHTLELSPLDGMPSLIRAKVPKISGDGTFVARGVRYSLRAQFADLPIRKIGANRVGLSSYYGKTFIDRATKKANSSLAYIYTRLDKATISPDEWLRDVAPGDVFDNYFESPYFYGGISEKFRSFKAGPVTYDFSHKGFRKTLDPKIVTALEVDGARICGYIATGKKAIVIIDKNDNFIAVRNEGREMLGDIYAILKMDKRLAPIDYAEIKIYSKSIPVAVFLGYTMGFRKLVKLLGAKHRLVVGKTHKNMQEWEYAVQFRDVSYIFDRRDAVAALVLAGFQAFEKETKLFDAELFDSRDVYVRLMEAKGISNMYLSEMINLQDLFIDPITERILKEMGEPTNFNALVIRACELLKTYYYPDSQDANYQRIRGYDRVAGFFYKELVSSIRAFRMKNRTGRSKVEMSPFQVWSTITRDSAVKQAEDINPVQALKISQEAVTYVGEGGRGKESMNRASRAYTESNLGVLSEASVDSSDVGINAFLSANPGFISIDGLSKKDRPKAAANLLSTSALLSPYSMKDD